ncbi:MAG: hypothetical protein WEE50_09425, partial [Chloroflexota bacterium]
MSALLKLYPPAWRARYGDEMASLLDERPLSGRDRVDLVRGALDAWLRPATPSMVPIVAALLGGGLWTVAAVAVLAQPVPLDWPGYLAEVVPLATAAAANLFVAALGCALRAGEARRRALGFGAGLLALGYIAWIAMLGGTFLGVVGGPALGASQAVAMLGTIAIGLVLVRDRFEPIGLLLLTAPIALLVPWVFAWP